MAHPEKIIDNTGAKVGDYLVLTKKIGTGVLTTAVKRGEMPEGKLNEAILSMTTLNADAASVMQKYGVKAATDVTGFGLLGHLGNMLRASSESAKQDLGARLSYSKIPKFSEVEAFLEKGLCPLGTRRNLETAAPLTTFSEEVSDNKQLLLADAQTSGGLLMAIPKEKLKNLLQDLRASNVPICAVIGQIISQDQPARIHVEL